MLNVVWDMKYSYLLCIYSELDGFSPPAWFFPPCYEVVSADLAIPTFETEDESNLPTALAEKTGGWWAVALAIREEEICDSDLAEEQVLNL